MPKQDHISLRPFYDVCMHGDCPLTASCLRHIAFETLRQTETILRLINPDKCTKSKTCPYYRKDKTVVYARGFTQFQQRMFPRQYQTFMSICMDRSLGFASAPYDSTPYSGSPSLRLGIFGCLTSPDVATRRLIMQKARRHHLSGSDRL